jgi:hypothetical protein
LEDRVREEMKRENISADDARLILVTDDDQRRKWGLQIYGIDTWNPLLYDIVLHIGNMQVDHAVSIILHALSQPCFQTTAGSQRRLDDMSLAAQIEAALVKEFPKVSADARNGEVYVSVRGSLVEEKSLTAKATRLAEKVTGVKSILVNVVPFVVEE